MRVPSAHRTSPVKGIAPTRARNNTVLPAPFGPITTTDAPVRTEKLKWLSTDASAKATDRSATSRMFGTVKGGSAPPRRVCMHGGPGGEFFRARARDQGAVAPFT